ncbi:MAG TPA: DUF6186 family protein [Mycobacterium sp.]|nr:DUF6186 family protein [Mycobacterium sp.]
MTERIVFLIVWAVVAGLLIACEVLSWASRRQVANTGRVLDLLTRTTGRMIAMFIGWMWVGWHFFAR